MAYIKSKKVYAILMNDPEGKKIVEGVSQMTDPELESKLDAFFGNRSSEDNQAYGESKGRQKNFVEDDEDFESVEEKPTKSKEETQKEFESAINEITEKEPNLTNKQIIDKLEERGLLEGDDSFNYDDSIQALELYLESKDIVKKYSSDFQEMSIRKGPKGFYNVYGEREKDSSRAGPFATIEEAEKTLKAHRPTAIERGTLKTTDDNRKNKNKDLSKEETQKEFESAINEITEKEHKSSITHPEDFDGDIDFNETADLNTNYENGEVDYLSNTYLSRIYDLYNGNENAMIQHLRQFDTGVSNGDMQGIVEAFVINKKRR